MIPEHCYTEHQPCDLLVCITVLVDERKNGRAVALANTGSCLLLQKRYLRFQ